MRRLLAILALGLFTPAVLMTEEVQGAKDLFYDPTQGTAVSVQPPGPTPSPSPHRGAAATSAKPGKVKAVKPVPGQLASERNRGLRYWIELEEPGGKGRQVTGQQVFHSGQRIRLHFASNVDGRILLVQLGASGTSTVLFPDPARGLTDNHLKAGQDRVLPSEAHWFRFDANPGIERLVVLFARDTAELERFPVRSEMGPTETKTLMESVGYVQGSKDLVIETEARVSSEVGTYGVNLTGAPVVLEISLQHR